MRCLTLARSLVAQQVEVTFACRKMTGFGREAIVKAGCELLELTAPETGELDDLAHSSWLGVRQREDVAELLARLKSKRDWIIVDHYGIDERWETAAREACDRLMVIDDLCDRHHECNLLLNQNVTPDGAYADLVPATALVLAGPRFALLRDEFAALRCNAVVRHAPVRRILVFFGGTDAANLTGMAIKALMPFRSNFDQVTVIVGAEHPSLEEIGRDCGRHNFELHVQTERMAELMVDAQLALGAAGSASWERACLGLPTIMLSAAENQVEIARSLDRLGAGVYCGPIGTVSLDDLIDEISQLTNRGDRISRMSQKAFDLVDGSGCRRVADQLMDMT